MGVSPGLCVQLLGACAHLLEQAVRMLTLDTAVELPLERHWHALRVFEGHEGVLFGTAREGISEV